MSGNTGYGITLQGFVMPQLSDLDTALEQAFITQFGAGINTVPSSFFGQIIGIVAAELALVWQAMQDVYLSQSPVTAFGASLDNVGALVGIPRLKATFSVVNGFLLFGVPGTLVPAFTQFSVVESPSSIFQLLSSVTLAAGQSSIQTITFSAVPVAGDWGITINGGESAILPYNATAAQVQTAIQALPFCSGCTVTGNFAIGFTITFAGAGTGGLMPQPTFATTPDTNTLGVVISYTQTQQGIAQASVIATATVTGPIYAPVDFLTNIVTPVTGLTAAANPNAAVAGTNLETDSAYRARIAEEQQVAGAGTLEAIRARLLTVPGVTGVVIYENISDVTIINAEYEGDDLPPHSYEAFISGTAAASDIAEMLWLTKPAGIRTYGTQSFVITDSQGINHTMQWSVPVEKPVYMRLSLLINPTKFPAGGVLSAQTALVNYVNSLGQGNDLILDPYLIAQLASVPGIDGLTLLLSTDNMTFAAVNIDVTPVETVFSQISFITVTTTPG
jgi:uncharacterized phage protein gp47/JayE